MFSARKKYSSNVVEEVRDEVEQVLDEVIFMRYGQLVLYTSVDNIREQHGKSVDAYFREVFAC